MFDDLAQQRQLEVGQEESQLGRWHELGMQEKDQALRMGIEQYKKAMTPEEKEQHEAQLENLRARTDITDAQRQQIDDALDRERYIRTTIDGQEVDLSASEAIQWYLGQQVDEGNLRKADLMNTKRELDIGAKRINTVLTRYGGKGAFDLDDTGSLTFDPGAGYVEMQRLAAQGDQQAIQDKAAVDAELYRVQYPMGRMKPQDVPASVYESLKDGKPQVFRDESGNFVFQEIDSSSGEVKLLEVVPPGPDQNQRASDAVRRFGIEID